MGAGLSRNVGLNDWRSVVCGFSFARARDAVVNFNAEARVRTNT